MEPGEAWSDAARELVANAPDDQQEPWINLLTACRTAVMSSPAPKWIKLVKPLLTRIGEEQIRDALVHWFPLTAAARTQPALSDGEWQARCMGEEFSRNYQIARQGVRRDKPFWECQKDFVAAAQASGNVWAWLRNFADQSEVPQRLAGVSHRRILG